MSKIEKYKFESIHSYQWLQYAIGYLGAANHMCLITKDPGVKRPEWELLALAYNYRHGIELLAKAILYGSSEKHHHVNLNSHDLEQLSKRVPELIAQIDESSLESVTSAYGLKTEEVRLALEFSAANLARLATEAQDWSFIQTGTHKLEDPKNELMRYPCTTNGGSLIDPCRYLEGLDIAQLETNSKELLDFACVLLISFSNFLDKLEDRSV